jgi:hypothetical protein
MKNTAQATFTNDILVLRTIVRPEYNQHHLTVAAPGGWDDVKKMVNRVLMFENQKFTFMGWNSDRNEAYFARPLNSNVMTAYLTNKTSTDTQ